MPKKPRPAAIKVFYSYAREDEDLRKRLDQHFSFLKREEKIASWYDGELKAGEKWRGKIDELLNSADVILLLISAAFADSEFCYSIEMSRAMERHELGEAVVVPILLHPCDWNNTPFAELQALPGGDKAISEWQNIEKALYEVAKGVRKVVEELIGKRAAIEHDQKVDSLLGAALPKISKEQVSLGVPRNEKLDQTLHVLRSYRNNLSKRALDKSDVDEYHSRLEIAESELKCDLNNFRIPPSAIKERRIPQSVSIDMFGKMYGNPYRTEYYVPADAFKTYLDALINFIDQKLI
jgi:hypothetical protein